MSTPAILERQIAFTIEPLDAFSLTVVAFRGGFTRATPSGSRPLAEIKQAP
jgi:hypothetical protein